MANYSDHYIKFNTIYFILAKDKALTTLAKFVKKLVMPLGVHLLHLHADGGGQIIDDYYRDYYKTTAINQHFHIPELNSLCNRNGSTIMDVAR